MTHDAVSPCVMSPQFKAPEYQGRPVRFTSQGLTEISMPVEFNDISVAIVISALTLIFTHKPDIGPNVLARLMFIYQLRTPHHVKRIF